jgi:hypothetical protein
MLLSYNARHRLSTKTGDPALTFPVGSGKIKAQTVVAAQKEKSVPIPNTVIQLLHKSMQGRFWFLGKEELCEKT